MEGKFILNVLDCTCNHRVPGALDPYRSRWISSLGAFVNRSPGYDTANETLLQLAVRRGNPELVASLLEAKADAAYSYPQETSPLYLAAQLVDPVPILRLLVQHGFRCNHARGSQSPLHVLAYRYAQGWVDEVKAMVAANLLMRHAKCKYDALDHNGEVAASRIPGSHSALRDLLSAGTLRGGVSPCGDKKTARC